MKLIHQAAALLAAATTCLAADSNKSDTLSSRLILPATFTPPQVFKNVDLVRLINLEKGYVKESLNVVVQNVDKKPQSEYYIPFEASTIAKVGGFEVRDKKVEKPAFKAEVVEYDPTR